MQLPIIRWASLGTRMSGAQVRKLAEVQPLVEAVQASGGCEQRLGPTVPVYKVSARGLRG